MGKGKNNHIIAMKNVIRAHHVTETVRYSTLSSCDIDMVITEYNVDIVNGYARYKQLDGNKECYLAFFQYGEGMCLKARKDITLPETGQVHIRWRYYGTITIIQPNEHVASVPIDYLIKEINWGWITYMKHARMTIIHGRRKYR